jgi:hypothetical protein
MPEFEPDGESVLQAEALSSRLMHDLRMASEERPSPEALRELFSEQRYSEQAEGVPIDDVVANVSQMADEFAIARYLDGEIPCLVLGDGELAPISMNGNWGESPWPSIGSAGWFEFWERFGPFPLHRVWKEILRRSPSLEEGMRMTDLREAEGGIERSLSGFLSYRFAGIKRWAEWIQGVYRPGRLQSSSAGPPTSPRSAGSSPPPPPAVAPGGGLQVQVSCLTPGLRIHVSPAYFINWVYFGSPTTPVASYVLPGRYIFAGDGPMLPRRKKDPTIFCIPADYHPAITRF